MTAGEVVATARALVAGDQGLLVTDKSNPACNKRFAQAGIAQTEKARRAYRALIVTTADDSSRFSAPGNGRIARSSSASGSWPGVGPGPLLPVRRLDVAAC